MFAPNLAFLKNASAGFGNFAVVGSGRDNLIGQLGYEGLSLGLDYYQTSSFLSHCGGGYCWAWAPGLFYCYSEIRPQTSVDITSLCHIRPRV